MCAEVAVGGHGEGDGQLGGFGAVAGDGDVELAGDFLVNGDGAHVDSGVADREIAAGSGHPSHGVGGLVMTGVLELGGEGEGFTGGEAAVPSHVLVFQDSFAGRDDQVALPGFAAVDGGVMEGDVGSVGHTRGDTELEAVQSGGGFRSQDTKGFGTRGGCDIGVGGTQGDGGGTRGGVCADILDREG